MHTLRSISRLALSCAVLLALAGLAAGQDAATTRRVTTPGAAGSQVQINQIETSQFPKVVIFATILKDGEPAPNLTDKDFRKDAVLDYYEDKITTATWKVHRGTGEVYGHSDSLGQKFSVKPEARGDQTRVLVKFEEKARK